MASQVCVVPILKISLLIAGWLQLVAVERAECEVRYSDSSITLSVATKVGGTPGLPQTRNQERT